MKQAGGVEVAESVWLIPNSKDWSAWSDRLGRHLKNSGDRLFVSQIDTRRGSGWGIKNVICANRWVEHQFEVESNGAILSEERARELRILGR